MAKHAIKSPSSATRWMTCPGSVALSKSHENKSSAYADEGTAAHFLAAECLVNEVEAIHLIGRAIELRQTPNDEHYESWNSSALPEGDKVLATFAVDSDMAEAVQVYLDYVRDLVKSSGGILFSEIQVPIDHLTGEKGDTGTSDTIILAEDEIIVVDLKFGRGVEVSAIENKQMRIYASGAIRFINDLAGGEEKIKRVRVAISQPRITHQPSEWDCSIEDLWAFEERVQCASNLCDEATVAFRTKQSDWAEKYLQVSEDACRFCRAKAGCPKIIEVIEEAIGDEFVNLDAVPPLVLDPPPDNTLLGRYLASVDLVEGWCKSVRAEAESQLLQGNAVPGYKLVRGKMGNRSWLDEALAERTLKKLKLKKDEMYETKLISPTTAEKVIGKANESWKQVQNIITQKEGGLSVAPESDKRPAIEVKPMVEGFAPLD